MEEFEGYILLVAGLAFATCPLYFFWKGRRVNKWPIAEGRILASWVTAEKCYDQDGGRETVYTPQVNYEYYVDSIRHTGTNITFVATSSSFRELEEEVVSKYPKEALVEVFYNPGNSTESYLEKNTWFTGPIIFMSFFALVCTIGGVCLIVGRLMA